MGSTFEDIGKQPPAPPPAKYIDEISGVEQVPVKNSDGSITYITRQIPLSADKAAKKTELEKISSEALSEIQRISSPGYIFSESTQKVIDDYQALEVANLNDNYDTREELESDMLAKRGLSDSTASNTVTRQTKEDKYDATKQIEQERSLLGQKIKSDNLAIQQNNPLARQLSEHAVNL